MVTIYLDKQIFSYLFKSNEAKYKALKEKILSHKDDFIFLYSDAHLFDLQKDNTERKFAEMEFMQEIEDFQKIIILENLNIDVFCLNILDENARKMISNFDIDILVCNAAIGNSGSVAEFSVDDVRKVFDTNVFAHLECIQIALEDMICKKKA